MGLWTFMHFITIIPTFGLLFLTAYFLRKVLLDKSLEERMLPLKIVACILVSSELIKQIVSIIQGYDLYHLPLHVCSLFIYLIPLLAFYRGKHRDIINTLTGTCMMALFMFMIISPTLIYSENSIKNCFIDYLDFHTVFFHSLVIFAFFIMLSLNLIKINLNHLKYVVLAAIVYVLIASTAAQLLKTNFSNFYISNVEPINQVVNNIKNVVGASFGQFIYVGILGILHVGFFVVSYFAYVKLNMKINNISQLKKDTKNNIK